MLKRMMVALAAVLAMFGLAASPAAAGSGLLTLYSQTNFTGTTQTVQAPTQCTAVNSQVFPAGVLSAVNDTNKRVEFFTGANCTGTGTIVEKDGGANSNFGTARVSYRPVNSPS